MSPLPVFVCSGPTIHGHRDSWGTSSSNDRILVDQLTDDQREAARAERRDVVESNEAWTSAETVRREWLCVLATQKTAPKSTATFIAAALAREADLLADVGGNHLAADLRGVWATPWPTSSAAPAVRTPCQHRLTRPGGSAPRGPDPPHAPRRRSNPGAAAATGGRAHLALTRRTGR